MIICKFGGSSIRDAKAMRRAAEIVLNQQEKGCLVVLSALGGVTDILIRAYQLMLTGDNAGVNKTLEALLTRHQQLLYALIPKDKVSIDVHNYLQRGFDDLRNAMQVNASLGVYNEALYNRIIGMGELFSSRIFHAYLNYLSCAAHWVDIRPLMRVIVEEGEPQPDRETLRKAASVHLHTEPGQPVIVTQGFIATDEQGAPATLGRDGSDYTAALLGEALRSEEIQIWSDVDGILSADPSVVPGARPLRYMTFDEACELAYFGARVLHPATILPAVQQGIPVRVLNSRKPDEKGTLITSKKRQEKQHPSVLSIAYKEHITLLTLESERLLLSPRLLEKVFDIFSRHGKGVYAVNKTATKLTVTLQNSRPGDAYLTELSAFGQVHCETGKAVVSVVGEGIRGNLTLGRKMMDNLQQSGVNIELFSQFHGQISLMFIIDEQHIKRCVKQLHTTYIGVEA